MIETWLRRFFVGAALSVIARKGPHPWAEIHRRAAAARFLAATEGDPFR